jgi:hypothetical protein
VMNTEVAIDQGAGDAYQNVWNLGCVSPVPLQTVPLSISLYVWQSLVSIFLRPSWGAVFQELSKDYSRSV